ncbi:MAG: hypothetical protein K2X73_07670 [Sphingomonas sp.]|uniref:hypothetical protein n=1 Tax=Sphingomonas sp. TaxID=28214 RepID=UPI0025E88AAE|nr:hypothetical protein [Sphingomonas sp.]MBX9881835.1 hypothetical protein [Sphingomonas sp.]
MRPQPIETPQTAIALPPVSGGNVAEGGVVADWQRMIEARFAELATFDQPSRVDIALRHLSRAIGIGALAAGYAAMAWFFFG